MNLDKILLTHFPGHIYWQDKNNIFLGCNELQAKTAGLSSRHDLVGRTVGEFQTKEDTAKILKVNNKVMRTGIPLIVEESSFRADKTKGSYVSFKMPLHDPQGNIIGLLGISFDITHNKDLALSLKKAFNEIKAALKKHIPGKENLVAPSETLLYFHDDILNIVNNSILSPPQGMIIDLKLGAKIMDGDEKTAKEMITFMLKNSTKELKAMAAAYKEKNWQTLQEFVHKLRGGTLYCGTPRLQEACFRLEDYLQSGQTKLVEPLYQQILTEFDAVKKAHKEK